MDGLSLLDAAREKGMAERPLLIMDGRAVSFGALAERTRRVARRLAGRMTARYDIDIHNVALYWHFVAVTAVITAAVIGGFPLVAGP